MQDLLGGPRAFTHDEIEQMYRASLRVLDEIGLQIPNATARERVARAGGRVSGDRVYLDPAFVEERVNAIYAQRRERPRRRIKQPGDRLTIGIGDMCQYYHSPYTDEIELMTTANVVEATQCVQAVRDQGIGSYVPGVPRDVPQQLQAILEYRIGSEFATDGPTLDTLHPPEALPYLFAMAEAAGRPLKSGGMFTVSPLRLVGYEFDITVQYAERWDRYWVTSYPGVGATAPVRMRAAWVTSIAEALGGGVVLHILGDGKPVDINIGMFPFDLRTLTIAGGMPEIALMYWCSSQVNRYFNPNAGYSMVLSTQAKRPGPQAGMEKAWAGAFGVMTGCDDVHYAGVMSFDDIYSPEQMMLDLELRDALDRLRRGIPEEDPDCWLDEIREGVERGYVQADATLDHHRETYWFPKLLDRMGWHSFRDAQATGRALTERERARDEIISRLERYSYRPPESITSLRRIFEDAWRHLGGDPNAPYLKGLYND
jgi:trimethylamine---corrinoid protein Co-methyltransferase